METIKQADIFFDKYAQRFNNALQGAEIDIEATVGAFAACFVESRLPSDER